MVFEMPLAIKRCSKNLMAKKKKKVLGRYMWDKGKDLDAESPCVV